ncbi:hypothetical protein K458DRAFT_438938 [Lentithecium fluviatile CBS 122367]|uniref:ERCC1-like central domain-containing protein n=1 Tax=Lentithecium fluviatile CBS 122367 TaxID=1168545 RepID=A0A6G1JL22_9PLEO|nr:hypothetical protein K458DRAFT_438938 [Lentithecium fluviatile CBS 122367]
MDDTRPRDAAAASASTTSAQTSQPDTPSASPDAPKVQQPKPQALPSRSGPNSILVSPRQKGNPILNGVRTVAWEYSDIPADYVLGATTCALFLSLKYHRLHPEYIYNRIRDLKGQYQLRILLVMVDIENHEESLRELSKTSLINDVTIMLTWSAQEAGRYLELFKTFEHAAPTSIKAQQSLTYSDNMVEFITVPRSINKTDAVGLVSNFGSIRTAVNAGPEELGLIAGWGTKKVQRWCNSVREPFRIKKAAKRGLTRDNTQATSRDALAAGAETQAPGEIGFEEVARARVEDAGPLMVDMARTVPVATEADADARPSYRIAERRITHQPVTEKEGMMRRADAGGTAPRAGAQTESHNTTTSLGKRKPDDENLSEVFSFLEAPDLKAARGVCTKFRDNASVWLFRKLVACARYQAMGAFQRTAEHSVYRTYVKEIVFDGTTYEEQLAKSEILYQESANRLPDLEGVVSWARRSRFMKYKELYQEQEDIISGHVLLQTLARALEWQLPNVHSVFYSPEPHNIPLERRDMKEILPRCMTRSERKHDGFHHLIGAIYISNYTGIHDLVIEPRLTSLDSSIGGCFYVDIFKYRDPTHIEAGKFFFRNLRKIHMALAPTTTNHREGPVGADALTCLANMAALLSEANELQDFSFQLACWHPSPHFMFGSMIPHGQPIFPHLGFDAKWPKLRSLRLQGVYADEEEVKELIARHKGTLISLELRYCSLLSGKWSNIVDEVLFGTNMVWFVLNRVNELHIGDSLFEHLSSQEMAQWWYEGRLAINEEGERFFAKSETTTSVYAWRNQDQAMDS